MSMKEVLDPTGEVISRLGTQFATRLKSLKGARVGMIDNGKPNADLLLDSISQGLLSQGVSSVHVFLKEHVGVPVNAATIDEIRESCDFVVAAIGDCGSCSAGTAQDSLVLEQNGIPAVSICTQPFAVTARAMAASYGAPEFEFLFTKHPVASLSGTELHERAEKIVDEVARVILERAK